MKGYALFQGEIITKQRKLIKKLKKSSSPEPLGQFKPKIGTKNPWVKKSQVCSEKGPHPFPRADNYITK